MEELSTEEWAYWIASYRTDPWGDDWERTSVTTVELINAIGTIAAGLGGVQQAPDPMPSDLLVPYRKHVPPGEQMARDSVAFLEANRGL